MKAIVRIPVFLSFILFFFSFLFSPSQVYGMDGVVKGVTCADGSNHGPNFDCRSYLQGSGSGGGGGFSPLEQSIVNQGSSIIHNLLYGDPQEDARRRARAEAMRRQQEELARQRERELELERQRIAREKELKFQAGKSDLVGKLRGDQTSIFQPREFELRPFKLREIDSSFQPDAFKQRPFRKLEVESKRDAFGIETLRPVLSSDPSDTDKHELRTVRGQGPLSSFQKKACIDYLQNMSRAAAAKGNDNEALYLGNEAKALANGTKDRPDVQCPSPAKIPDMVVVPKQPFFSKGTEYSAPVDLKAMDKDVPFAIDSEVIKEVPVKGGLVERSVVKVERVLSANEKADAFNRRATNSFGEGDYDGAVKYYKKALAMRPDDRNVQLALGEAMWAKDKKNGIIKPNPKVEILLDALQHGNGDWDASIDYTIDYSEKMYQKGDKERQDASSEAFTILWKLKKEKEQLFAPTPEDSKMLEEAVARSPEVNPIFDPTPEDSKMLEGAIATPPDKTYPEKMIWPGPENPEKKHSSQP